MSAVTDLSRSLIDALPNPVLALGPNDEVCFANTAAENFFQTSRTVLARQRLTDLVPFASPAIDVVGKARDSSGFINEYAVTVGTPRLGGERQVDLQVAGVHDEPDLVLLMILQRSVANKLDRQLTHRSAARSVSGMAAMLAHEIKNPLAGIRGAAQLIEPSLAEHDRALARLICEEADRISGLVNQMEVFSDERPLETKPVNIHVVLAHVKTLIQASLATRISFKEHYDPSLPSVLGSRDQLIQVFMNLVKNAVEAIELTGKVGEISLSTAFHPGVRLTIPGSQERVSLPLEVRVADNGPGISEELRPLIFEPFVSTKRTGKGLGLALVAKIVRDHGGIIECDSSGRGTQFRILLPIVKEEAVS
jgi:two-component system, NtrC family, nitrogen regulation sensor histidine kinase GlnL